MVFYLDARSKLISPFRGQLFREEEEQDLVLERGKRDFFFREGRVMKTQSIKIRVVLKLMKMWYGLWTLKPRNPVMFVSSAKYIQHQRSSANSWRCWPHTRKALWKPIYDTYQKLPSPSACPINTRSKDNTKIPLNTEIWNKKKKENPRKTPIPTLLTLLHSCRAEWTSCWRPSWQDPHRPSPPNTLQLFLDGKIHLPTSTSCNTEKKKKSPFLC